LVASPLLKTKISSTDVIFQAVLLIGGVITTANQLYTASELEHQLQHSKAICLFTSADLLEKVSPDICL
jgi:long-subunit acyl-CoA synthetase (AMP-forming)